MQDIHVRIQRLDYENLDVYRWAIEFLAFAFPVINSLQRGDGELRDQLKRVEPAAAEHGKGLLVRIVSMLTRMCR